MTPSHSKPFLHGSRILNSRTLPSPVRDELACSNPPILEQVSSPISLLLDREHAGSVTEIRTRAGVSRHA